jgi:hypothetical protein
MKSVKLFSKFSWIVFQIPFFWLVFSEFCVLRFLLILSSENLSWINKTSKIYNSTFLMTQTTLHYLELLKDSELDVEADFTTTDQKWRCLEWSSVEKSSVCRGLLSLTRNAIPCSQCLTRNKLVTFSKGTSDSAPQSPPEDSRLKSLDCLH